MILHMFMFIMIISNRRSDVNDVSVRTKSLLLVSAFVLFESSWYTLSDVIRRERQGKNDMDVET